MLRLRATLIGEYDLTPRENYSEVRFRMGLPEDLFPVRDGGLQLLVNLLAGDTFPTEAAGCSWSHVHVHSVTLPAALRSQAIECFRGEAHTIEEIRGAFELPARQPLLAYSLKPRVGPTFDEIRRMTLDVLAEGFNIVELDSRNLALRSADLSRWIDLGREAAQVGSHKTAFSPNLSIPAPQLIDVVSEWTDKIGPLGPPVVKIDGGLDGLSGLQAVRRALCGPRSPYITSYPILRNWLGSAIGDSTWAEFLSLSGADIIYPGGRPTFPNEQRPVWGSNVKSWSSAARGYDEVIHRHWPMPTLAGGVHPGQLQALYELLGPNVAYFLGGAVALHPEGPAKGARLCADVLKATIELADDAMRSGDAHAYDLPGRLLNRVEGTPYPNARLNYFSPKNIFGEDLLSPPLTFYRRG